MLGDLPRGVVGFEQDEMLRHGLQRLFVANGTEAEIDAVANVLLCLTDAETRAVAHPATHRVEPSMHRQNNVGGFYFVDNQRLAETFRQGNVALEDDALTVDVGTAEAVDAAFADGNDLRMARGGFEQAEIVVVDGVGAPRVYAYGIQQSRRRVESAWLHADYADSRIRLMGMCVDEHYGTGS